MPPRPRPLPPEAAAAARVGGSRAETGHRLVVREGFCNSVSEHRLVNPSSENNQQYSLAWVSSEASHSQQIFNLGARPHRDPPSSAHELPLRTNSVDTSDAT